MALPGMIGREDGPVFEHGAGDGDRPVGDGPQGAGMAVAAGSKGGIPGFADRIALHSDACPVMDGVAQTIVSGQSRTTIVLLPGRLATGAVPHRQRKARQSLAPQGIECFCEQRGEDDLADSGKGNQDRHVTLPFHPRLVLRALHRGCQGFGRPLHPGMGLGQMPPHQGESLGDGVDTHKPESAAARCAPSRRRPLRRAGTRIVGIQVGG